MEKAFKAQVYLGISPKQLTEMLTFSLLDAILFTQKPPRLICSQGRCRQQAEISTQASLKGTCTEDKTPITRINQKAYQLVFLYTLKAFNNWILFFNL